MKYMYELDYTNLNIDKDKFMDNLKELHYKDPRDYYYSLEEIFKRLGDLDNGENIASILDDCKLIYENGISEGYGKFVFFSDTLLFFHQNEGLIFDRLDNLAYSMGCSEDYPLVDLICRYSEICQAGYLSQGKKYLEEFIRDPETSCNRFYNMLVWLYVQDVVDSLMEEDSKDLLKGAIK